MCADAHVRVCSLFDLTELLDETLDMDAAQCVEMCFAFCFACQNWAEQIYLDCGSQMILWFFVHGRRLPLCQIGTDGRGILPTADGLLMRSSILPPEHHIPPALVLPAGLPNSPQNQLKGANASADSTKLAALEVQPRRSVFQSLFGSAEHDLLDLCASQFAVFDFGFTACNYCSTQSRVVPL